MNESDNLLSIDIYPAWFSARVFCLCGAVLLGVMGQIDPNCAIM